MLFVLVKTEVSVGETNMAAGGLAYDVSVHAFRGFSDEHTGYGRAVHCIVSLT